MMLLKSAKAPLMAVALGLPGDLQSPPTTCPRDDQGARGQKGGVR